MRAPHCDKKANCRKADLRKYQDNGLLRALFALSMFGSPQIIASQSNAPFSWGLRGGIKSPEECRGSDGRFGGSGIAATAAIIACKGRDGA